MNEEKRMNQDLFLKVIKEPGYKYEGFFTHIYLFYAYINKYQADGFSFINLNWGNAHSCSPERFIVLNSKHYAEAKVDYVKSQIT